MWRIARDSRVLDLNASYAYVLWCRDFAATSMVACVDGQVVGFVIGYRRPKQPATLMVWQVAVDDRYRGRRLASRMLDALLDGLSQPVSSLETTITPTNVASTRLFSRFAQAHGAQVLREPAFDSSLFPEGHESELLFRIGPLS